MTTCTRCLLVLAMLGFTTTQYLSPPLPGTATSGTNYRTDESARQETIDDDGTVRGQYSYVDPSGKTIAVRYTAGKDGFKIVGEPMPTPEIVVPSMQESYFSPQKTYQPYKNYERFPSSQFQQDLQGYQSQRESIYQSQGQEFQPQQAYQPKFTQALFSPAQDPYPAATAGQVKALQNYLEEERMEMEKQGRKPGAQAHVSVQTPNQDYSYNINY